MLSLTAVTFSRVLTEALGPKGTLSLSPRDFGFGAWGQLGDLPIRSGQLGDLPIRSGWPWVAVSMKPLPCSGVVCRVRGVDRGPDPGSSPCPGCRGSPPGGVCRAPCVGVVGAHTGVWLVPSPPSVRYPVGKGSSLTVPFLLQQGTSLGRPGASHPKAASGGQGFDGSRAQLLGTRVGLGGDNEGGR